MQTSWHCAKLHATSSTTLALHCHEKTHASRATLQLAFENLNFGTQMQALGLSPNANSEAVQRSYRRALNDAKGDKARVEKIEAAHTRIMMSGLTQRMKVCRIFLTSAVWCVGCACRFRLLACGARSCSRAACARLLDARPW